MKYNKIHTRTKFVKARLPTPAYTKSEKILALGNNGTRKDQQKLWKRGKTSRGAFVTGITIGVGQFC